MNNLYGIDWVLTTLNLYSYYLIGNKRIIGFILGTFACILGIILFSILTFNIPMLIMYLIFGILNIINYFKWLKELK